MLDLRNETGTNEDILTRTAAMPSSEHPQARPSDPRERRPVSNEPWALVSAEDGTVTYRLQAWAAFYDFLHQEVFPVTRPEHNSEYVWRGHRRSDWTLSSTLHRAFCDRGMLDGKLDETDKKARRHLEAFKYAARGRRGASPLPLTENEWWALGQHYGLATPLLDWCRSPFAAAYFAFEKPGVDETNYRVVYGLNREWVEMENEVLTGGETLDTGTLPIVQFIEPMSDDNPRLVSQAGLFTRTPLGLSIEEWISTRFEGMNIPILLRIEVPNEDRRQALLALDRMNINHSSLFPDLMGASRFVNLNLELGVL